MRNNRNTIGDQWKSQRPLTNSVQRKTMTNPQLSQPQSRHLTQQQQNQKMASTINNALLRVPNQGNRSSISNSLQPKASTMISTITTFMNSIDHSFQKGNLDIQTIPTLLQFWSYPHGYNKSVFQPVGAPHTWPACLQMMEFFAEIAVYFFQYRLQLDQYKLDTEEIDLILQSFAKDSTAQYQQYLQKTRSNLTKQQQDLLYKIESSQLSIRNIKNSQRSVSELQAQQQILLQKLERQSQNVIEIDQQNNKKEKQIQKLDDQMEQLLMTKDSLNKKISLLEEQITTQELSYTEATKIELEIKQYNSRIKQLQRQSESKRKQFQGQKNKIVQIFYKLIDEINEVKLCAKRCENQMNKRNIQTILPAVDHVAFAEAVHSEDEQSFGAAVNKMIEGDRIRAMLISHQSLSDILQHQIKMTSSQLAQCQYRKSQTENQKKSLGSELQKLISFQSQLHSQLQHLKTRKQTLQQHISQYKQNSNKLKSRNQQLFRKQLQLKQDTIKIKQYMVQGIKMLKKYQNQCEDNVKVMEERQIWLKKKIEEILGRVSSGFGFLNGELNNLL